MPGAVGIPDLDELVGARFETARRWRGLSAKGCAALMHIARSTLIEYEAGHRTFPLAVLLRGCAVLDVELSYIITTGEAKGLLHHEDTA